MKARALFVALIGMGTCLGAVDAFASDNVCVINNSSQDVTFSSDAGTFEVGAKGGDQNKCWAFETDPDRLGYHTITLNGEGFSFGFVDPILGAGYFTLEVSAGLDEWPANNKHCVGSLCAWHTDKTDVWRLYVEDAQ